MAGPTAGLGALDQEREASMADEGGVSGAMMECENPDDADCDPSAHRPFPLVHRLERRLDPTHALREVALVAGLGLGLAMVGFAMRR